MRQFRTISIGLILLLGGWLVWRQVARRRTMGRYDAERTHNQSDNLTQPAEPAVPVQERADVWLGIDTTLGMCQALVRQISTPFREQSSSYHWQSAYPLAQSPARTTVD
jgi:ABC-type nickel/cobalt efflux system permease component RcnA